MSEQGFQLYHRTAQTYYLWDSLKECRSAGIEYFIVSQEMINNYEMGWIPSDNIYKELAQDPGVQLIQTFKRFNYPPIPFSTQRYGYTGYPPG